MVNWFLYSFICVMFSVLVLSWASVPPPWPSSPGQVSKPTGEISPQTLVSSRVASYKACSNGTFIFRPMVNLSLVWKIVVCVALSKKTNIKDNKKKKLGRLVLLIQNHHGFYLDYLLNLFVNFCSKPLGGNQLKVYK